MSDIHWTPYERRHIEDEHGVTATDFEEAWDDPDREDLAEEEDPGYGPYFRSIGATSDGRLVEMVWRWQDQIEGGEAWPITAYFVAPPPRSRRRRRRPSRR